MTTVDMATTDAILVTSCPQRMCSRRRVFTLLAAMGCIIVFYRLKQITLLSTLYMATEPKLQNEHTHMATEQKLQNEHTHMATEQKLQNEHTHMVTEPKLQNEHTRTSVGKIPQLCNTSFGNTLEENMAVVSNYPLDGAAEYLKAMGVFSTFDTPTRHVPVIATAASANHYLESVLLLDNIRETVIAVYPDVQVYYYDLGLTELQKTKISNHSFVHFRRFPFEDYPEHVRNLKGYTWKPIIIQAVLQEFGFVMWADASVRFRNENLTPLFSRAEENGIVISHNSFGLAAHTDIDTFRFLGEPVCLFVEYKELAGGFMVLYRTRFINDYVIKPWLACALLHGCMVTKNSSVLLYTCRTHVIPNECHRFDQSVISMILTRLYQKVARFGIPPEVHLRFCHGSEKTVRCYTLQ